MTFVLGVLRGERARFQLFGDTMNTCSRIEASSRRGCILVSKETAELLKKAGKEGWLEKRQDLVAVKGKGTLETYWVHASGGRQGSVASFAPSEEAGAELKAVYGEKLTDLDDKINRLVNWNTERLVQLLKQVIAHRGTSAVQKRKSIVSRGTSFDKGRLPLEEVREIIHLPDYDGRGAEKQKDPEEIKIPSEVAEQVHDLVGSIARLYRYVARIPSLS